MKIKKGSTDVTTYVFLGDSSTGAPETGLTITNLDLTYTRNQSAASKTDATALAAVDSAHGDNKAYEVDATNAPGLYRIDWPDAAFATGKDKVILTVTCSGCQPAHQEVQLVDYDPQDSVRLGITALPNAAAGAAGGLPTDSAGKTSFNDLTAAQVNTEADTALSDFFTSAAALVDLIWDEVLTAATHNVASSAGRRLRTASGGQLDSGTAQAGGADTITLATSASTTVGLYVGCAIVIDGGTGAGQSRYIIGYTAGRVATVARPWTTAPDATSTYVLYADNQIDFLQMGLAAAGGATSITLDSNASSTDEIYTGQLIRVFAGTGKYQVRAITAYNGTTKVATVDRAWQINPDSTSYYAVMGLDSVAWNSAWDAEVQSEVADGLTAFGAATAAALATVDTNVDTLLTRLVGTIASGTHNAQSGDVFAKFAGITLLAQWLGALAGKQAADATAQTEIRATGAGSGTYDPTTDSQEALSDTQFDPTADPVAALGTDAVDAAALATDAVAEIVAGILAGVIEGTVTLKQSLALSNAAAAGKLSGAATTSVALRNLADTLDRIAATVDADGNRTATTQTFTDL